MRPAHAPAQGGTARRTAVECDLAREGRYFRPPRPALAASRRPDGSMVMRTVIAHGIAVLLLLAPALLAALGLVKG